MASLCKNVSLLDHLPATGYKRASEILKFLPFKKSTLWQWSKDGRFPTPIRLSGAMTCWRCEDVHAWLASQGKTLPVVANDEGVQLWT